MWKCSIHTLSSIREFLISLVFPISLYQRQQGSRIVKWITVSSFLKEIFLVTQSALTCSKSTIETAKQFVKSVNNKDTRTTSMTPFCFFIVSFEPISHIFLVFSLLTLSTKMPAGTGADIRCAFCREVT